MVGNLAIKKLTASDLTLFKYQFETTNVGKQKAINMNANILRVLYPSIFDTSLPLNTRYNVDLIMYGPGLKGEYLLARKILKQEKNWRLNGELVPNPIEDPGRFDVLAPEDFAIMEFNTGNNPEVVSIVFVSNAVEIDKPLHSLLVSYMATESMKLIFYNVLEGFINSIVLNPEHPAWGFITAKEIEDIALGGSQGRERLLSQPTHRKMSAATLQKAKEAASRIGNKGEQFINEYFRQLQTSGIIKDFEWVSFTDAISPFDFKISFDGTTYILVDVKSTEHEYERNIHISYSELKRMASGPEIYDIYRVYSMKDNSCLLRISHDMAEFAQRLIQVFKALPTGVFTDSISLSPSLFTFEDKGEITNQDITEEDEIPIGQLTLFDS